MTYIGSQNVYKLDHRKPVLYVIPVQNNLGKLPVIPVGNTGTIPYHLRNAFSGAPGDRKRRLSGRDRAMAAGCGLSTSGHWDGPWICNAREGGSARNTTWRKAPCERAAAVASPLSGSARGCTIYPVQNSSGFSNSITVTENTD